MIRDGPITHQNDPWFARLLSLHFLPVVESSLELSMLLDREVEVVALIWGLIHLYPGGNNV